MVDHFYLVQLANRVVTEIRRRITGQQRGRRGRKRDKERQLRNRLTRNAARMPAEHVDALVDDLAALPVAIGKPILATWNAKKDLLDLPATARTHPDRTTISTLLHLDDIGWARARTRTDQHFLALIVLLKAFGRLGYFPDLYEVPLPIVEHIRKLLELKPEVEPEHDSDRTLRSHKQLVRERLGITSEPERARALAERVIREAVLTKDQPPDLINVALEELVRARLELPGYTTLDEMAAEIRTEVNKALFAGIAARMSGTDALELDASLEVDPVRGRSRFDEAKAVAGAATATGLRARVRHLAGLETIGPTGFWLEGVPPAKIAHFAGEAQRTDISDLRKYGTAKRQTLVACLFHVAKVSTRDDIATMLCKRIAAIHKKAREHLEGLREASRAESERLLGTFGEVLAVVREALTPPGEAGEDAGDDESVSSVEREPEGPDAVFAKAGRLVLATLERSGGVDKLSEAHEVVSAYQGNNYLPFVEKFYRGSRAGLFDMLDVLEFEAASADVRVLKAVEFLRSQRKRTHEHLNITVGEKDGKPVELDLSFASESWRRIVVDPRRRARVIRRHFEACVFSYLAAELRTGDIAVTGSEAYANFMEQLLAPEECEPLVAAYCREAGLPADAAGAVAALRTQLEQAAARSTRGSRQTRICASPAGGRYSNPDRARNAASPPWTWRTRSTTGCPSGASWRS